MRIITGLILSSVCLTDHAVKNDELSIRNGNHIFNAIHSSMRQWGSSLNHNGMSIFPAIVPAGTMLYHGRDTNTTVPGLEWVAFERDHAMQFAHQYISQNPGRPGKDQQVLSQRFDPDLGNIWSLPGFFQSYKTKTDLHLFYLDGSAAAKSSRGTLDVTDLLLRNLTNVRLDAEHDRARHLCQIAREDWNGRIDGFIRMEAGFEIIICSFPNSLELIETQRTEAMFAPDGMIEPTGVYFHWLRAATNRYDGIGGMPKQVSLNYERFFSAYTFDFDIFPDKELPRLGGATPKVLHKMREVVRELVDDPETFDNLRRQADWQAIADMIVQKYARPLQNLITSQRFRQPVEVAKELNYLLRPFIDTAKRDPEHEISRCVAEHVFDKPSGTAGKAIEAVIQRICSTLVKTYWSLRPWDSESLKFKNDQDPLQSLQDLVSWLLWTEWKKCKGCDWDEICSIPMFPFGFSEDHIKPRCRRQDEFEGYMDYWNDEDDESITN